VGVRPNGQEDTPQYKIDIDQQKATALGLQISEINSVLSVGWGSSYVNDFLDRGRVKKCTCQGEASRACAGRPEQVVRAQCRRRDGAVLGLATGKWIYASPRLERYNGLPSVEISVPRRRARARAPP
jgi:multidrug efflux pump